MLNGIIINPMSNKNQKVLYEQLVYDISKQVKYQINEAYDNALLEEYGAKDLFTDVIKEASKDTKILFKLLRKFFIFVIERLQETNQYKKAEVIVTEYKKRIQKYIDEHKKITPRRMFKIIVTILTIYGGVSLIQDCKHGIQMIQQSFEQSAEAANDSVSVDTEDSIIDFEDDSQLDAKEVKTADVNSTKNILPSDVYKQDSNYQFISSNDAREFIKKHEMCLLYPYYANAKEESEGKVTIGYGHVVLKTDGALYTKIQKLKKQGKIKQSFVYDKKQKKLIINPNHCPTLITAAEANQLFLKDIKTAEDRAFKAIKSMNTDDNVKCYMLYNQKIRDGLTSLCYNAGNLKQDKYSFIKNGLANCRFDYNNNCINAGDYNVSFSMFKKIKDNPNRRAEEYNRFFVSANKPIDMNNIL